MPSDPVPCAASFLLVPVLSGDQPVDLTELVRTRLSVHYATGRADVPVLSVAVPSAVQLPNSVLCDRLPGCSLTAYDGTLHDGRGRWRVARWWTPPRPHGLRAPHGGCDELPLRPHELVGRGPGLTPSGDDVLAGALVAAYAVGHPRLPRWRDDTLRALQRRRTTAVSHALLLHAADGWAVPQLADFVEAVCSGGDVERSWARLRAVGHSSGEALAEGALTVLAPALVRSAA